MKFSFFRSMKITFFVSMVLIILSLYHINKEGLDYGIEFMGGTEVVIKFEDNVEIDQIRKSFTESGFSNISIQEYGKDKEFLIRLPVNDEKEISKPNQYKDSLKEVVDNNFSSNSYSISRIDFIGPKVGKELIQNGIYSIIFGSLAILIYVFIRFSFSFAIAAVIALFHDFIITTTLITYLNVEITLATIAALLTVIGYSVNDTIVIFDRVRENMKITKLPLSEIIDTSIFQTLSRTVLTVLTVLIVLVPLYFFGGVEIEDFALIMIIGVTIGTYSSILFAPYIMYYLYRGKIEKNV
tara:strand:+ start:1071 stop:1961 length:891 start_codon:yes stop_codon:yes gene_type:complete